MFTFSKDLNLLIADDLSAFFNELEKSGHTLPVSSEAELGKTIQFSRQFFPDSAFEIKGGMTPINIRPKHGILYSFLEDMLPAMWFLYTQRENELFVARVKANLANLPQFDDTLFEVKCLKKFSENRFSFWYEPGGNSRGKDKNPDFQLSKDGIELFCECKRVRIGQNKAELQFGRQCDCARSKFPQGLERRLFDKKLRLEINFKSNPSATELDELIAQVLRLYSKWQDAHDLPLQQIGSSIEYLIISQDEPSQFPMKAMRVGSILLGNDKPRGILSRDTNSPTGEVLITSTDLARRREETLKRCIREAKNQLPDDKLGLIIIDRVNLKIARQAIEKRMNGRHYNNIVAFVVNPFENFWSCYRICYTGLLSDLFEGFQDKNPFQSS